MSAIPPSIRKILDSGRGEIKQLERQYHIWLIITIVAVTSGIILIVVAIILFLIDTEELTLLRILVGIAAGGNFIVSYVVFQETLARRRYLLEVRRLMVTGMSFLDSVKRGIRDLFK